MSKPTTFHSTFFSPHFVQGHDVRTFVYANCFYWISAELSSFHTFELNEGKRCDQAYDTRSTLCQLNRPRMIRRWNLKAPSKWIRKFNLKSVITMFRMRRKPVYTRVSSAERTLSESTVFPSSFHSETNKLSEKNVGHPISGMFWTQFEIFW